MAMKVIDQAFSTATPTNHTPIHYSSSGSLLRMPLCYILHSLFPRPRPKEGEGSGIH